MPTAAASPCRIPTAAEFVAMAQTWLQETPPRPYARYQTFSDAIRLLAKGGWTSKAIDDRLISQVPPGTVHEQRFYEHICYLRRSEGI